MAITCSAVTVLVEHCTNACVNIHVVTGMPYGTVNLREGVPDGETPVTCTAGVGTYIVEFGTLSRLTGDPVYEEVMTTSSVSTSDVQHEPHPNLVYELHTHDRISCQPLPIK